VKARRTIKVIGFTSREGIFNMALDYHLFHLCESGSDDAFLRLYTWTPPALSLGRNEPRRIVDTDAARRDGIDVVRRPTGGRVVLHKNDLTYTLVLPFSAVAGRPAGRPVFADVYRRISECIVEALRPLSAELTIERGRTRGGPGSARPCFASTSRYEITHRGRKVVGSAQRVGRRSVLQHGSIPVGRDYLEVSRYLAAADRERIGREVAAATTCLEEIAGCGVDVREAAGLLRDSFAAGFDLRAEDVSAGRYEGALAPLVESLGRGEHPVSCEDNIT